MHGHVFDPAPCCPTHSADPAGSGAAGTQGGAADAAERGTASAGLTDPLLYATRRKTVHPPIRIRDMAPHKFARIRKQYRISNSKYLDSLSKVGGERKGPVSSCDDNDDDGDGCGCCGGCALLW